MVAASTWDMEGPLPPQGKLQPISRWQQSFWNRFNSLFFYASVEPLKIVYVIFKFKAVQLGIFETPLKYQQFVI